MPAEAIASEESGISKSVSNNGMSAKGQKMTSAAIMLALRKSARFGEQSVCMENEQGHVCRHIVVRCGSKLQPKLRAKAVSLSLIDYC